MNRRFFLYYIFCVLCSTSVTFGMEIEPEKEAPFNLTKKANFEKKAVTESSLLFKTQQDDGSDDECIIYTPSVDNFLITIIANNNTLNTYNASGEPLLDTIVSHATIAHKHDSVYTMYVAIKIPKKYLFGKDTYSIQKIDFDPTKKPAVLIPTELFTHDSPIAHMGIVKNNEKDYLVVGSLYPSIKIYNLTDHQTDAKPIILHNRFLLGCMDNTIIYAKKNTRPSIGLTRWLDSRKTDKPFDCTLYHLTAPFKKDDAEPLKDVNANNISLTIHTQDYPVISEQNNTALTFVNNDCICYLISKDTDIFSVAKTQLFLPDKDYWKQKKLENLLHTNANWLANSIKKQITLESFKQFAYENSNNTFMLKAIATTSRYTDIYQNAFIAFIQWTIHNFFAKKTLIDDSLVIYITGEIANPFISRNTRQEGFRESKDSDLITINEKAFDEENTYISLQEKFSEQFFKNITGIQSGTNYQYFLSKEKHPTTQLFKKTIQVNKNYTILYTNKKILVLDNKTKETTVYNLSVNNPDISINHVIFINDNMYLLSDKQLYAITIPENREKSSLPEAVIKDFINKVNATKEEIETQKEVKKEKSSFQPTKLEPTIKTTPLSSEPTRAKSGRSDQEKYNLVDQIITNIKSDTFINSMQFGINKSHTFTIDNDNVAGLPSSVFSLAGAVTDLFTKYYLSPIIKRQLALLLQDFNTFTKQEISDITSKLTPLLVSSNIWFQNVKTDTAYGALQSKIITKYADLTTETKQILKDQFYVDAKYFDEESEQNLAIIKSLSFCLALEEEKIASLKTEDGTTVFENKTFMEYVKELLLKNAENLKNDFNIDESDKDELKKLL